MTAAELAKLEKRAGQYLQVTRDGKKSARDEILSLVSEMRRLHSEAAAAVRYGELADDRIAILRNALQQVLDQGLAGSVAGEASEVLRNTAGSVNTTLVELQPTRSWPKM